MAKYHQKFAKAGSFLPALLWVFLVHYCSFLSHGPTHSIASNGARICLKSQEICLKTTSKKKLFITKSGKIPRSSPKTQKSKEKTPVFQELGIFFKRKLPTHRPPSLFGARWQVTAKGMCHKQSVHPDRGAAAAERFLLSSSSQESDVSFVFLFERFEGG